MPVSTHNLCVAAQSYASYIIRCTDYISPKLDFQSKKILKIEIWGIFSIENNFWLLAFTQSFVN